MKKRILLAAAIFLGFTAFSQVQDQPVSPIPDDNGIAFFNDASEAAYQSFTAGITGELVQVDLSLSAFGLPVSPVIEIFAGSVEGGNLGSSPLGSTTVNVSSPSSTLVSAMFSGVEITAGVKYSIKINGKAFLAYNGGFNNPYSGGQHTTIEGAPDATTDVHFQTFVIESLESPLPRTKITSSDCGKTLADVNQTLTADVVDSASFYHFQFLDESNNVVLNRTQGRSDFVKEGINVFRYYFFRKNFLAGTTYKVAVRLRILGSDTWSEFGDTCSFISPGAGPSVSQIANCGTVFTSWNNNVNAVAETGATKYRYIFSGGGTVLSYTTPKTYVKLSRVAGLVGSTEYTVQVRVLKNGTLGEASTIGCTITTPFGSPRNGEFAEADIDIFMYPNPTSSDVVYFSSEIHNVSVFDIHGNLMKSELIAESLDISELSAGFYMVKSDEGLAKLMVK